MAFASATNSPSECAGTLALTANSSGFFTSNGDRLEVAFEIERSLVLSAALTVKVVGTTSSVWPSGAALATASVPIIVLAPERFSTMTGWPSAFSKCGCMQARQDVLRGSGLRRHDDTDRPGRDRVRRARRSYRVSRRSVVTSTASSASRTLRSFPRKRESSFPVQSASMAGKR